MNFFLMKYENKIHYNKNENNIILSEIHLKLKQFAYSVYPKVRCGIGILL